MSEVRRAKRVASLAWVSQEPYNLLAFLTLTSLVAEGHKALREER